MSPTGLIGGDFRFTLHPSSSLKKHLDDVLKVSFCDGSLSVVHCLSERTYESNELHYVVR
jgi:hypothetical protein